MTEAKRTQLKQKVAAGQKRNEDRGRTTIVDRAGERAIEAKDNFVAFAKQHPIATLAGGLAVGILVSSLFKRSPTRKLGGKAAKTAGGLAAIGAELALAYAQQALETANEAGRVGAGKLEDIGETIGKTARSAGRSGAERAGDLGDAARAVSRDAGKRLSKALRDRFN